MASLILHIGTHKTGTTFLQATLRRNADKLAEIGWHFPLIGGRPNHVALGSPFWVEHAPGFRLERLEAAGMGTPAQREAMLADFDAQIAVHSGPDDHWIVSAENFWTSFARSDSIAAFAEFLHARFDSIKVIAYLRRQDHYLTSRYAQSAKSPGVTVSWSWEEFLQPTLEPGLLYDSKLAPWMDSFGEANVIVRPYLEAFKKDSLATLNDFIAAAGIPEGFDWQIPDQPQNTALSAEGVAFIHTVEEIVPVIADGESNRPLRRRMYAALRELTDPRPVQLTPEMLRQIQDTVTESNAAIVKRLNNEDEWQPWLDQRPPSLDEAGIGVTISPKRTAELMAALAVPNGPVDWGQPFGRPLPPPVAAQRSGKLRRLRRA